MRETRLLEKHGHVLDEVIYPALAEQLDLDFYDLMDMIRENRLQVLKMMLDKGIL